MGIVYLSVLGDEEVPHTRLITTLIIIILTRKIVSNAAKLRQWDTMLRLNDVRKHLTILLMQGGRTRCCNKCITSEIGNSIRWTAFTERETNKEM